MSPFIKLTRSLALKIALGVSSPGEDMRYHPDLPSRMVIIPRHNTDASKVIDRARLRCDMMHL